MRPDKPLQAGQKLREQAITRTRNHLALEAKPRGDLARILGSRLGSYSLRQYVTDERLRLKRLENLL